MTTTPTTSLTVGRWSLDPAHSSLRFQVVIPARGVINGRFDDISGTLELDEGGNSTISARVSPASISTGEAHRDEHLRGNEFFDSENFPEIVFEARGQTTEGESAHSAVGELDLHGHRVELPLEFELVTAGEDHEGDTRVVLRARGGFDRHDFGFDLGPMDAGVGSQVDFDIDAALVRA